MNGIRFFLTLTLSMTQALQSKFIPGICYLLFYEAPLYL